MLHRHRHQSHTIRTLLALLAFMLALPMLALQARADDRSILPPANEHFQQRWERTDKPVADLRVNRTWMWGPGAFTSSITEPYAESPNGYRQVQYFDKARMEINHPGAHAPNLWYVTTGRLAWELITGQAQFGDNLFEDWHPAEINVAGDLEDSDSPTYASLGNVLDVTAVAPGTITRTIDRDGNIQEDSDYLNLGVGMHEFVETTGHWVADPFWQFMHAEGLVYEDNQYREDDLFLDPVYAIGHPITDPYWTRVTVGGFEMDVLVQAFERRVLTYTPGNTSGWEVESGNIGHHYYLWYYGPHE